MRDRDAASIIGVVVLIVLLFGFLGGGMMGFGMWPGMMGRYYNQSYGSWWGIVMLLFWPLVIGGVALLITRLVRQDGQTARSGGQDSSLEILRQRYARGEITREQYQQMRHDLE